MYALVSVNGKPVPASVAHQGATLQVRSGAFTINADGTCVSKMIFVPPSGTEATREVRATYTKDGSKLTMQWNGAGKTVGTIDGNTFTMENEGMALVYDDRKYALIGAAESDITARRDQEQRQAEERYQNEMKEMQRRLPTA